MFCFIPIVIILISYVPGFYNPYYFDIYVIPLSIYSNIEINNIVPHNWLNCIYGNVYVIYMYTWINSMRHDTNLIY